MGTYNSLMDRANDVGALIPEEYEREIFKAAPEQSAVMQLGRRLRDMARAEREMRVLDGLATAYFVGSTTAVSGDSARIQTSEASWDNVILRAAKLGVIVPIPKDVLEDQDYDLWGEIRPQLDEAFGKAFDAAVLYGTNAPSDWPTALVTYCAANSKTRALDEADDLYDAVLGESGVISIVEECGYMVTGHIGAMTMKAKLRNCRDAEGRPLFIADPQAKFKYSLDGEPVVFPRNGSVSAASSLLVSGDWSKLVWAFRKGITYEILREATIFNSGGTLQYSLAQDDLVALKAVMRVGWQLPNPPNRIDASTQYPFAVLTSS